MRTKLFLEHLTELMVARLEKGDPNFLLDSLSYYLNTIVVKKKKKSTFSF